MRRRTVAIIGDRDTDKLCGIMMQTIALMPY